MRTADALVAETAAVVTALATEETGKEAAVGDMMRKERRSRCKDINKILQRVYDSIVRYTHQSHL